MLRSMVECYQRPWYPIFTSLGPPSDFSCRSFRVTSDSHCCDRDTPWTPVTSLPAFYSQDFSNTMEASAWTFRELIHKGNSQLMRESRRWIIAPDFIIQKEVFCMLLRGSKVTELLLPSVATSSMHAYVDFSSFCVPLSLFFLIFSLCKETMCIKSCLSLCFWVNSKQNNGQCSGNRGEPLVIGIR